MFIISTICLLFILLPQVYYYSKMKIHHVDTYKSSTNIQPTILYSNKLASVEDVGDHELLLIEKNSLDKNSNNRNTKQTLSHQ